MSDHFGTLCIKGLRKYDQSALWLSATIISIIFDVIVYEFIQKAMLQICRSVICRSKISVVFIELEWSKWRKTRKGKENPSKWNSNHTKGKNDFVIPD